MLTVEIPELLPIGENEITLTATDASENEFSCIWIINVQDLSPPTIFINPVTVETQGEKTFVDLGDLDYDDFDDNITIKNNAPDPSEFSVGQHVVTWNATDSSDNVAFFDQDVLVFDITPPTISPTQDIVKEAENGYNTPVDFVTPTAEDISGLRQLPNPVNPEPVLPDIDDLLSFGTISSLQ